MTSAVVFLSGVFMDKTILGILIGSLTTLLGMALTSLFNHLTKRKELRHNEHLKELELKDRAKERKFKVEEKMIEKAFDALAEGWHLWNQTGIRLKVYEEAVKAGGLERAQGDAHRDVENILISMDQWFARSEFFLPRRVRNSCREMHQLLLHDFIGVIPREIPETTLHKLNEAGKNVRSALESILEDYHPFYKMVPSRPERHT
jgi:hypothetical protein